jgi:hypothetical protein
MYNIDNQILAYGKAVLISFAPEGYDRYSIIYLRQKFYNIY